jgi:flagellar assembly protein FliH
MFEPSFSAAPPLAVPAFTGPSAFRSDTRFAQSDASPAIGVPTIEEPPTDLYAQGWAEGHAAALAEMGIEMARRSAADAEARASMRLTVSRIDAALEARLAERLRDTVAALCEATLAPLARDPDALAARVVHAAAMLARAEDERVVRLHPDDLALLAERLDNDLTLLPDAALARGAVRVEGAAGGVEDGPEQWRAAIAAALAAGAPC